MALDPSISLQAQPAIINPLTTFAQVSQINSDATRNKLLDLAVQDKQREVGQNNAVNNAYKANLNPDGSVNVPGLVSSVAQSGYGSAVPGIQKSLTDAQVAQLNLQKTKNEVGLQQLGAVGQTFGSVKDQPTYEAALQHAAQVFGPQSVANFPQQYDPNFVAGKRNEALTVQQQLEQHNKEIDQALQQSTLTETQRHNVSTEDNTVRGQNMTFQSEANGQNVRSHEFDSNTGNIIDRVTGQANPVLGQNGQPIGPKVQQPNEYQSQSAGFGARALASDRIMTGLEGKYSPAAVGFGSGVQNIPLVGGAVGGLVNSFTSDENQQVEQARRDFVNAILRRESGASIAPSEFKNADLQYFPQPGDSPAVIAQKAANRQTVIRGLQKSAGGAWYDPSVAPGQQQAAPTQSTVPSSQRVTQQRGAVPAGTVKTIGGKSYQFDGHGWLQVQ